MAYPFKETTYDLFGGVDTVHNPADIPQLPGHEDWKGLLHMAQADNVFQPNTRRDLIRRPGWSDVRATAINAAGIITGMVHLGEIADEFLLAVSIVAGSHNFYRDNANPPGAIAGGTNFTIGADNLVDWLLFTDGSSAVAIAVSRLRDLPQSFTSTVTRADFTIAGTGLTSLKPQFGEVFGQRALWGAPDRDGTVEDDFWYWTDKRDGNLITDYLTQRESVQTKEKDRLRAIKRLSDVCLLGKLHNIFLAIVNPLSSRNPFTQRELPAGRYRGPVGQQAVVEAEGRLWWMGQTNIHSMDADGQIRDHADLVRDVIEGLADDRRQYAVAWYDHKNDLVCFSVTNGGGSTHTRTIALNIKTGAVYPNWTLTINAAAPRLVSGEHRVMLGGYVGLFRRWDNAETGNADSASAAIDGDVFTPRHHVGYPTWVKLFLGIKVVFDQQGTSEAVTVQYRLDDASSWTSFAESPYTVGGTAGDVDMKFFRTAKAARHIQFRFRDANSGQKFRIQKYTIVWKLLHPALMY